MAKVIAEPATAEVAMMKIKPVTRAIRPAKATIQGGRRLWRLTGDALSRSVR